MKQKLITIMCFASIAVQALQVGDLNDTTPVSITDTEYAGTVSLVSLAKAQSIADGLSEAAALKWYHYGDPNQVLTPDAAFGFDLTTGLITNYNVSIGGLEVVVPYQIGGVDVVGTGRFAFSSESSEVGSVIESIILPKSFSLFGVGVFLNCTNLLSLVFNGSSLVAATNNLTFSYFEGTKITSVSFPHATSIPLNLFKSSSIESFSGPNVKTVEDYAFRYCYSLTNVILSSSTYVGEAAFAYCYSLCQMELPSVEWFGAEPFTGCSNLLSIVYSSDVPTLDPGPSRPPQLSLYEIPVTNYVVNPTASGWSETFGGRPVVRSPAYADEFYLGGAAVSESLYSSTNWVVRPGLSETNEFVNASNRPQAWSGTGAMTVSAFNGMQSPIQVYWTLSGFDSVTLPSSVHFIGGGSWQTNAVNHFTVWTAGTNVLMSFLTTTPID